MMSPTEPNADLAVEWREICASIAALAALDAGGVVHDAEAHEYSFRPCLTAAQMEAIEQQLEVRLPPEILHLYTQVGNGGVGPDWGLVDADQLHVTRARDDAEAYLPGLPGSDMLYLATRYYDWPMYLVCSGPWTGSVVSAYDGVYERLGGSIAEVYRDWLRREHLRFAACQRLVRLSDDISELWRRRDEVLTDEMEDDLAPGMYAEQGWLILYLGSLCADGEHHSPWSIETTEDFVQRPDVRQAYAAKIQAYRERVCAGSGAPLTTNGGRCSWRPPA